MSEERYDEEQDTGGQQPLCRKVARDGYEAQDNKDGPGDCEKLGPAPTRHDKPQAQDPNHYAEDVPGKAVQEGCPLVAGIRDAPQEHRSPVALPQEGAEIRESLGTMTGTYNRVLALGERLLSYRGA